MLPRKSLILCFMGLPPIRCFGFNLDNVKPTLIDSNAEMPTRAKRKHAERLSEKAPKGDAIVCSHGKENHERPAEMTGPLERV